MLPGLKVKIGADTRELERGLSDSQARILRFAKATAAAMAAASAATLALGRASMNTIDAQAKLARSLGTTTKSVQILSRAGDLAGVSMSGIEQATKDLTRRLSQAASGTGPASDALKRLGLSVNSLMVMPLDQRIMTINDAINKFVPAAQRAAVAGQLFGEEGSLAMARIDTATLQQATKDIDDFGVAVSDVDAADIERTNDAISRLSLVAQGFGNRVAVALAPAMEALADAIAAATRVTGPLAQAMGAVFDRIPAYAAVLTSFGAVMAGKVVAGIIAARLATVSLSTALVFLRGALIRTGIGALIVLLGEGVYWLSRITKGVGGVGEAMKLMGEVWSGVWAGILRATEAIPLGLSSVWSTIAAGFYTMVQGLQTVWADFLHGMVNAMRGTALEGSDAFLSLGTAAINAGSAVYETQATIERLQAAAETAGEGAGTAIADGMAMGIAAADKLRASIAAALGGGEEGPPEITPGASLGDDTGGAGAPGGGAVSNILQELQALTDSFKTAEQLQIDSFQRQQQILDQALRRRLVTAKQYAGLMEKVEATHQFKMKQEANRGVSDTLNALGNLFQGSKKIGAAIALANSWMAFTEVLKDPSYVGRPFARFAAAASALASGLNAVRSIKSVTPGGGGGGGAATAGADGGGAAAAAPAAPAASQTLNFSVTNDPFGISDRLVRQIVGAINQSQRDGSTLIRATVS